MKTVPVDLSALLNDPSITQYAMADLYTFQLRDGSLMRFSSADVVITIDGNDFLPSLTNTGAPMLVRGGIRQAVGIDVDDLEIQVFADDADLILGSQQFLQALARGVMDGAILTLDRLIMPDWVCKNLLSANQADLETGTAGCGTNRGTFVRDTSMAWHGAACLKSTCSVAGGNFGPYMGPVGFRPAVSPGVQYSSAVYAMPSVDGRKFKPTIEWKDAAGGSMGTTLGPSWITLVAGTWTRVTLELATAPAGAVYAVATLYSDAAALVGDIVWTDGWMFNEGGLLPWQPAGFPSSLYVLPKHFLGRVDVEEVTRTSAKLRVKSPTELLNIKMPRNIIQPSCSRVLYDAGCAVNKAALTQAGAAVTGSSKAKIVTGIVAADGFFDLGVIQFTSGACAGLRRGIRSFLATGVPPAITRASVAYDRVTGQQVAAATPRKEAGPWAVYYATPVEEASTFLPANAFFTTGVGDWTLYQNGAAGVVAAMAGGVGGDWSSQTAQITVTTSGGNISDVQLLKSIGAVTNGQKIAVQVRIKASAPCTATLACLEHVAPYGSFGAGSNLNMNVTANWQQFSLVATANKDTTARVDVMCGTVPNGTIIWVDFLVAEVGKAYCTSPSDVARSAESFPVSLAGAAPAAGTWEQWVDISALAKRQIAGTYPELFGFLQADGTPALMLYHSPAAATFYVEVRNDAHAGKGISFSDVSMSGFGLLKVIWCPSYIKVFWNNVLMATLNLVAGDWFTAFGATGYIGGRAGVSYANTKHGPCRLSKINRETEVADLTAPPPMDANTLQLLQWADGGTVQLSLPLPAQPAVGDTFQMYPGCSRTVATCESKYANRDNFRGCPFVPVPETLL